MIPASAGRQRKRKRAKKSKQSSEGQELEAAVVWELGVGVEDEQHSSTVVDLLGSFYSGCLPQGFPVALLLPAMQVGGLHVFSGVVLSLPKHTQLQPAILLFTNFYRTSSRGGVS